MTNSEIIECTIDFVKDKLKTDCSGHDWWHVYRVWKLSKQIAKKEGGKLFIIELGALLHDIADWKFHDGSVEYGATLAQEFLSKKGLGQETVLHVQEIIRHISFKGAGVQAEMETLEGKIVQDADRLDALGAIGIARTFAYGGHAGNPLYEPDIKPTFHNSFEEYKNKNSSTINHFYEKLFLLKDRMNTKTGKNIALDRHEYMESFIDKFMSEWYDKLQF
jgi:uncharacterized protein